MQNRVRVQLMTYQESVQPGGEEDRGEGGVGVGCVVRDEGLPRGRSVKAAGLSVAGLVQEVGEAEEAIVRERDRDRRRAG